MLTDGDKEGGVLHRAAAVRPVSARLCHPWPRHRPQTGYGNLFCVICVYSPQTGYIYLSYGICL